MVIAPVSLIFFQRAFELFGVGLPGADSSGEREPIIRSVSFGLSSLG